MTGVGDMLSDKATAPRAHRNPNVTNRDMATLARLAAWGEGAIAIQIDDFPVFGQFAMAGLVSIRSDGVHLTRKGERVADQWQASPADWRGLL